MPGEVNTPVNVSDADLAKIGVSRHEYDRLNEAEKDALLLQLELPEEVNYDLNTTTKRRARNAAATAPDADPLDEVGDPEPTPPAAPAPPVTTTPAAPAPAAPAAPAPAAPAAAPTPPVVDVPPVVEDAELELDAAAFDGAYSYTPGAGEDPVKLKEQLATLKTARDALIPQIDEGKLSVADGFRQTTELSDQISDLTARIADAQRIAREVQEAPGRRWEKAQDLFLGKSGNKLYTDDPIAYSVLSTYVQEISKKPENVERGMMWLLYEADRQTRIRLGLNKTAATPAAPAAPAAAPAAAAPAAPPAKPPPREPDLSGVTPTIGSLPAADINSETDPFAHIDNLDGPEQVAAISKMTAAQKKAYLDRAA